MKKDILFLVYLGCLLVFLSGCGEERDRAASGIGEKDAGGVTELADADITIPAGLVGNEMRSDNVPQVEEGSSNVIYSLSGEERSDILEKISADLAESISAILADKEHYPDIVSITPDADCTEFVIALKDGGMNTYEAMLAMSFYIVGNKYQIYSGIPAAEAMTTVRYVDADTGEVVSETDSSSMDTQ